MADILVDIANQILLIPTFARFYLLTDSHIKRDVDEKNRNIMLILLDFTTGRVRVSNCLRAQYILYILNSH